MILGTAGHIDHGKTTLVRALTGVDTDRLPEEKKRGITIELGFAPLRLDGVGLLGVVDVPGHEAFVRTMLAGATGVDLALLVIAADEGVMPQTREHLAILDLLGVRGGVVALTKRDLVTDEDWLELVREDVRALLAGSALRDAPVVDVSAATGQGIDALRAALARAAAAVAPRTADDLFRMPIDRAFTVRGTGTVVTGTVWSGSLARDAAVRLWPLDRQLRLRGLQAHGAAVDRVGPGERVAIALPGVEVSDVGRGGWLVGGAGWMPSTVLRADVLLLADAPRALGARTAVRFHLGTTEVAARVVVSGGALQPGERRPARIVLERPVVARAGDRFVLRLASPAATIGGGVVVDPAPPRRARPWPLDLDAAQRLWLAIAEAGVSGLAADALAVRLGVTPAAAAGALAGIGDDARAVGGRLVLASELARLGDALQAEVRAHHAAEPLDPGMQIGLLRSRVSAPAEVTEQALHDAVAAGRLELDGAVARLAGWRPSLDDAGQGLATRLVERLAEAGAEPPDVAELAADVGRDVRPVLRHLQRQGTLVQVEDDRYYHREALDRLLGKLAAAMAGGREQSPSELRDALGVSRKYLIPLLEHCDRVGYTTRQGSGRVWRGPRSGTGALSGP